MAILHVQKNKSAPATGGGGVTLALAFPGTVGVGNTVVGGFTWESGPTIVSVTDDKLNTYTVADTVVDASNSQSTISFYRVNITNAPQTITVTLSAGIGFQCMVIDEYSGISALDQHTGVLVPAPGTGTDGASSGNVTTTTNGDLIYGLIICTGVTSVITQGTGFTLENNITTSITTASEDRIQASAGAVAATFTLGTSGRVVVDVLAFSPTGGGPTLMAANAMLMGV